MADRWQSARQCSLQNRCSYSRRPDRGSQMKRCQGQLQGNIVVVRQTSSKKRSIRLMRVPEVVKAKTDQSCDWEELAESETGSS